MIALSYLRESIAAAPIGTPRNAEWHAPCIRDCHVARSDEKEETMGGRIENLKIGADTATWKLTIEYGPAREEIGSVTLANVTEEIADVAAQALLDLTSQAFRNDPNGYGCSIRMDRIETVGRLGR
jgi:hypothetical protein